MTADKPTCPCGRPIADSAYICTGCTNTLTYGLGDVTFLAAELEVTITRQSKTGSPTFGGHSSDKPLPFSYDASEASFVLLGTLRSWAQLVIEERGAIAPQNHTAALGTFLLGQAEWIRHQPFADEARDEIVHAIEHARRAIDRAPERLYAGPCDPKGEHNDEPCLSELYAVAGQSHVECRECGLNWKVEDRREYLVEAAQDRLASAYTLSRFLTAYGEPLSDDRIRSWVAAGHLAAHGHDAQGRPQYRVGDVTEVLSRITSLKRRKSA